MKKAKARKIRKIDENEFDKSDWKKLHKFENKIIKGITHYDSFYDSYDSFLSSMVYKGK